MNHAELRRAIRAAKDEREKLDIYRDYCKSLDYSADAISTDFEIFLHDLTFKDSDTKLKDLIERAYKEVQELQRQKDEQRQEEHGDPNDLKYKITIQDAKAFEDIAKDLQDEFFAAIIINAGERPNKADYEQLTIFDYSYSLSTSFSIVECILNLMTEYKAIKQLPKKSNIRVIKEWETDFIPTTKLFSIPFIITPETYSEDGYSIYEGKLANGMDIATDLQVLFDDNNIKSMGDYDMLVCEKALNMYIHGNHQFTMRQLFEKWRDFSPKREEEEKIYESLLKQEQIRLSIIKQGTTRFGWAKLTPTFRLLPGKFLDVEAKVGKSGFYSEHIFQFTSEPDILQYIYSNKQYQHIPVEANRPPITMAGRNPSIFYYLRKAVLWREHPEALTFETLYNNIGISAETMNRNSIYKAKSRTKETAKIVLEHFETYGLIEKGSIEIDDKKIKFKRTMADFNQLKSY